MEISFIHMQILVHLHERLRPRTHFETETKGNSEIAKITYLKIHAHWVLSTLGVCRSCDVCHSHVACFLFIYF